MASLDREVRGLRARLQFGKPVAVRQSLRDRLVECQFSSDPLRRTRWLSNARKQLNGNVLARVQGLTPNPRGRRVRGLTLGLSAGHSGRAQDEHDEQLFHDRLPGMSSMK